MTAKDHAIQSLIHRLNHLLAGPSFPGRQQQVKLIARKLQALTRQ